MLVFFMLVIPAKAGIQLLVFFVSRGASSRRENATGSANMGRRFLFLGARKE